LLPHGANFLGERHSMERMTTRGISTVTSSAGTSAENLSSFRISGGSVAIDNPQCDSGTVVCAVVPHLGSPRAEGHPRAVLHRSCDVSEGCCWKGTDIGANIVFV